MKTLIVYDSIYSNTKQIALTMAEALQPYGYVQAIPTAEVKRLDEADWDLLIVGGPTQLHRMSPALNALMRATPRRSLRGRHATAFDTRYQQASWLTGSAANQIAHRLRRAGAKLLLPPESFYVTDREGPLGEEEVKRAGIWATILAKCLEQEDQLQPNTAS